MFSVALSVNPAKRDPLAVNQHVALWSPDFPLLAEASSDHPAGLPESLLYTRIAVACPGALPYESRRSNSRSSRIFTPRARAFSSLEPGSAPATT